jgi:hypothetical protein
MTTYDQKDNREEAYKRLADPAVYRDGTHDASSRDETAVVFPARHEEEPPPAYDEPEAHPEDEAEYAEIRQRERFGGVNWGAGFFGWLVAVGMAVVLTGVVGAVVTGLDATVDAIPAQALSEPRTVALVAAAVLVVVLMLAYFSGGYVAGRMSRFDGGKQGAGVWVTGLLLTALALGAGLMFGTQYNILDRVALPSLPVPTEALGLGGIVTAVVALLGSLLAAVGGGKVGCRYHRKVDSYGFQGYVDH